MSAFTVELTNKPGELARICQVLANANVNLILSGTAHGDSGTAAFIADDEAAARETLQAEGIEFTERTALTVRMDNTPGSGAATFPSWPTPASTWTCSCPSASPMNSSSP